MDNRSQANGSSEMCTKCGFVVGNCICLETQQELPRFEFEDLFIEPPETPIKSA